MPSSQGSMTSYLLDYGYITSKQFSGDFKSDVSD